MCMETEFPTRAIPQCPETALSARRARGLWGKTLLSPGHATRRGEYREERRKTWKGNICANVHKHTPLLWKDPYKLFHISTDVRVGTSHTLSLLDALLLNFIKCECYYLPLQDYVKTNKFGASKILKNSSKKFHEDKYTTGFWERICKYKKQQ